ncbi:sensor domain-containing diguanylate cyclase [Marinobacterium rhizophilum]|uniref:diguanylate cyclase n=1 Tax=Marinobacterium rhizophilum TaxID=420402 RepID=A0ABY5HMB7_9GAMM|nr:sensor domain-containing diguanylate cyclase [Marinobacterium rhizophilum]UTW13450.1 diguanylate cyclase [Marinobacterium rhizophilum]
MHRTYQHSSLSDADATLNYLLDIIVEGTWDWHADTGRVERNPGWYRMLGYEVGGLKEDVFTWENIIHPDDYARVIDYIESFIAGKRQDYCIDYRCKKADGHYLWIRDRARIISRHPDGSASRIIGAHENIHARTSTQDELIEQNRHLRDDSVTLEHTLQQKARELEAKNQELEDKIREVEYISNTDQLTEIANRKRFEEKILQEIRRARRYSHPLSLALFDLDLFKNINDTHGHSAGDRVLRSIADLVRPNIRSLDCFARWGGEEFTLIFPSMALDGALQACEKLRGLIQQHEVKPGLCITASFGVSLFARNDSFEDLLRRADDALYRAKALGRNRVEVQASSASTPPREKQEDTAAP